MSGTDPRTLPAPATWMLLGLCAALLAYRLGGVPLLGPDEPRYSRVAIEMKRSGDLVTPTLQGEPWLEKPILYYWLAAAGFAVFGENEAAARLPAVLALLSTVAWTSILGARLYGRRAGLIAGSIVAGSALMFVYGRAATMDMLLAATLTAGLSLLALRRLGIAGPSAAVAGAACLGLATLAKGPLGLLLPALVLLPHWLLTGRRGAFPLVTPGAVLSFAAVALPWYVLVTAAQGHAFVDTFLLNHNVQRFTSTIHNHPGPPFYYLPVLLVGLVPWSGLLFPAAARFDRRSPADRLLACWIVLPLAFFSIAGSKLPGYILPVVPPLAVLMGRAGAALLNGERLRAGFGPACAGAVGFTLTVAMRWMPTRPAPWTVALPAGLVVGLFLALAVDRLYRSPASAIRALRVGAAVLFLAAATAAPVIVAARDSGRDLFAPAGGREVLVWEAWRTAWMAGYFYNDARVRTVEGLAAVVDAARRAPRLVLCGPGERNQLQAVSGIRVKPLAVGPRRNVLLEVWWEGGR